MVKTILVFLLMKTFLGRLFPDRIFLVLLYRLRVGKPLNLDNPRSFTEKIQWLKLNWRDNIITRCSDKYQVRKFVEEKIGPEILKELYGVYEKPEDIDLATLPDAFALKVNHGCKLNLFCKKKSDLDWSRTTQQLKKYLKENLYFTTREWAYKNIAPRIICEEYLAKNGEKLYEYGFYCYDGVPRLVEINEYQAELHRVNMFDLDLNLLENKYGVPPLPAPVTRPPQFDKMLEYSTKLSKGFPFLRVDLLYVNNRIYFGEMTFFPLAGLLRISPDSFDYFLGSYLKLPVLTGEPYQQNHQRRDT